MQFLNYVLAAGALAAPVLAEYDNNCGGSFISSDPVECETGIQKLDPSETYSVSYEFSEGNCYLVYAGNGGPDLDGKTIQDTARNIIQTCGEAVHGSFGTGNCDVCHVTVNYRG